MRKDHWRTRTLWLACVLTGLLLLAGCKNQEEASKEKSARQTAEPGKTAEPAEPAEPAELAEPAPDVPGFAPTPTAFADVTALSLLPDRTPLVIVAKDPAALLDRLGRKALIKKFANYYEKGVAEVTQVIGHNILDPKNFPEVGVDPHGPAGLAMFEFGRPVGVIFCKLLDPDKFKTMLYAAAGRVNERMEPHVVGDATVICPRNDEEVCFILKGDHLFFHFADLSDDKALERALQFAGRTAEMPSLATSEEFQATVARLDYGKDAALYLNTAAVMQELFASSGRWTEESLHHSQAQLKQARDTNDAEQVKYWEERVKENAEWHEKEMTRAKKQQEMMEKMLNGIGTAVMGAELTEKALKLKSFTPISAESPWSKVVKPLQGVSPEVKYVPRRPLYLAHVHMDIPFYLELLGPMLETEGLSMAQVREMFKQATQLDLDEDVLAAFTGEIGAAVTADPAKLNGEPDKMVQAFDGYGTLGITSAEAARSLLTRLSANPLVSDFLRPVDDNNWEVPIPDFKTLHVGLAEGFLVFSTDPEFLVAVRTGKGKSFLDELENEELKGLLGKPDSLGVAALDFGSFAWLMLGVRSYSYDSFAIAEKAREEMADGEEVPFSEEYRNKEAEMKKMAEEAQKQRRAINLESDQRVMAMARRIGLTAGVALPGEGGQLFYGGHYVADESVAMLIEHLIEDGIALETMDRQRREKVWKLEDKRWQLQRELEELRIQDIQKYHENKAAKEAAAAEEAAAAQVAPVATTP